MSKKLRRALVASDSQVAKDPRVLKQVRWLIDEGWSVDTLGRGPRPESINGTHFEMPLRPILVRILTNIFLPNRLRYRILVASTIPNTLENLDTPYSLAVINEIELLPWFTNGDKGARESSLAEQTHLDLHEYSPSQRSGLLYDLVFKRYRLWMTRFIPAPVFTSRTVVSPGIAQLYVDLFSIPEPAIVRNSPSFVELQPRVTNPTDIRLIHHGGALAARGLDTLIEAMKTLDERFSLHLMLVGAPALIKRLKSKAQPLGSRVSFPAPVAMSEVAAKLNEYDLEVIFYPPITENMRHALPNKIFEAIQGRLGIVIGESPDMMNLVNHYDNGAIVKGWDIADLVARVNTLTAEEIDAMKRGSHLAANDHSAEAEQQNFLQAIARSQ